jgi:hypothetical protein
MYDCSMQNRMAFYVLFPDLGDAGSEFINSGSEQFPFGVRYCPVNSRPGLIIVFCRSQHA